MRKTAVLDCYLTQNTDTAARVIDGSAVVVTPQDVRLHTMNEVGTFIWLRADGRRTVRDVVADVLDFFDVSAEKAERDALEFVSTCIERGILRASDKPAPIDLSAVVPAVSGGADRQGA
jgi:hypothetical protein